MMIKQLYTELNYNFTTLQLTYQMEKSIRKLFIHYKETSIVQFYKMLIVFLFL
jgi:hypothetical protein